MQRAKPFKSNIGVTKDNADAGRDNRAASRLKNINLTKLNASYERYQKAVPLEYRSKRLADSWHPVTPDHRSKASISQWNREISTWRKRVYLWNNIKDEKCDSLNQAAKEGDIKLFLRICNNTDAPASKGQSYLSLLDPKHQQGKIEPVLYKPAWFKGQIIHSGFCTIEEQEFLKLSSKVHQDSSEDFRQFYEEYIQSYTNGNSKISG